MIQPAWTQQLRGSLATELDAFFAVKRGEAEAISPRSAALVEEVASLTLRGGKRLRPIVLAAVYRAVTGGADLGPAVRAGAALELLQSYLLIHDDWMDLDDERRGGPSVFAALRDAYGDDHLGASLTVLAGDLASAYASELITAVAFPPARRDAGLNAFWQLQRDAFFGQQLDLVGGGGNSQETVAEVEHMYDLKTGSYTVRGPAVLGGILGGADDDALTALRRWANPLGIAFQLRDELLGTFGDPQTTGKPRGGDLRRGKHTILVAAGRAVLDDQGRARLGAVLGDAEASDDEVSAVAALLEDSGAKALVEERLAVHRAATDAALRELPFDGEELRTLTAMLVERDH